MQAPASFIVACRTAAATLRPSSGAARFKVARDVALLASAPFVIDCSQEVTFLVTAVGAPIGGVAELACRAICCVAAAVCIQIQGMEETIDCRTAGDSICNLGKLQPVQIKTGS